MAKRYRTWAALLALWMAVNSASLARSAALPGLPGVELISSAEVLARYTVVAADGRLLFRQPDGSDVPLITSVEDPEIQNPGEGAFFPASIADVEDAVRAIPAELLRDITVTIFVLPYPREGILGSSADGLGIYLTPGVRTYTAAEVHYLVAHELGHSFHRRHLPYGDDAWTQYRELRGLEDLSRFAFGGPHADRPQEIFAEDFRVLFGGALASGDGSVENAGLLRPDEVPGIERFFWAFVEDDAVPGPGGFADVTALDVRLSPNPVSAGGVLKLRLPERARVTSATMFDVRGRKLVRAAPNPVGDDGSIAVDSRIAAGAYWLRLEFDRMAPRTFAVRVTR